MTTATTALCPESGTKGKKVGPVTLDALVKGEFRGQVAADADCFFCDAQGCDVVYFTTDGRAITGPQLKVEVGVKQTTGTRPLCYCFGHSVGSIKAELLTVGRTTAVEHIRAKMADPGCSCQTTNPAGACCLGTVAKGIETAKREVALKAGGGGRGETLSKAGTVLSAVMASSCCWLPLLLLAFGVSGVGIAGALDAYRPVFIGLTVVFLAAAFYFTYRPRRTASGDCCAPATDCCAAPTTKGGFSAMKLNKVMLWGVTLVAVAFLFFPQYMKVFLSGGGAGESAADNPLVRNTTFSVDGMTCEGCSVLVEKSLKDVPGVLAARVDYDRKQAAVTSEACCPAPTEAVIQALQEAGYQAAVVGAGPATDPAKAADPPRGECCDKPGAACCDPPAPDEKGKPEAKTGDPDRQGVFAVSGFT